MRSSGIDQAIVALLAADAPLAALLPDGVFVDEAPGGAERFVIVALLHEQDEAVFGGRAIEDGLFLVKAVARAGAVDMAAAEARIDEVLEDAVLMVTGYSPMLVTREGRVRETERDATDETIRWLHRGGRYRVAMAIM